MKPTDLIHGEIYHYTRKDSQPVTVRYDGSDAKFKTTEKNLLHIFIGINDHSWNILSGLMVAHFITPIPAAES